eukprot:10960902-Heterocapsa_arctica.AAC.1
MALRPGGDLDGTKIAQTWAFEITRPRTHESLLPPYYHSWGAFGRGQTFVCWYCNRPGVYGRGVSRYEVTVLPAGRHSDNVPHTNRGADG